MAPPSVILYALLSGVKIMGIAIKLKIVLNKTLAIAITHNVQRC